jgi:hypothetical protein
MKISFVVNNLANSELSFDLIDLINKDKKISYNIFFQNHSPPIIQPECVSMNINGFSSISGKVVAFDLSSAMIIKNTNCNTENILYLYNMEWLQSPVNYLLAREILSNFKIFARSKEHAKIISNFTGDTNIHIAESMGEFFRCLT